METDEPNTVNGEREMTVAEQYVAGKPMPTDAVIEDIFTYHAPTGIQPELYNRIRSKAKELAYTIHWACAPGPDRTAAIRKLREAVMTANQSIATNNAQYR